MPVRAFDAVVFDLDGVLCDSEPFIEAAATEALRRRYGIEATHADFVAFVGAGDDRFISGAAERHGVVADLSVDKPLTYAIYLELIAASLQPVPGVHDFLRELRAAGLRLALATGSDRPKLNGNLAAIGLSEATFDVVVSAELVTRKKPDPDTFLLAIERLQLAPDQCLVVEDARNGVRAGRAAGCQVLGITSTQSAEALLEAGAFAAAPDFTAVPPGVREALGLAGQGTTAGG
jgi:beta-phosphoglucomutase